MDHIGGCAAYNSGSIYIVGGCDRDCDASLNHMYKISPTADNSKLLEPMSKCRRFASAAVMDGK